MKISSYMFGAALALTGVAGTSNAATIANFTFETVPPTTATGVLADVGVGVGSLTSGSTVTNPAGNSADGVTVSNESFSANSWDVGEYYQFSVPTGGYEDISVAFDQTGSNTGPRDWTFAYTTNGTTYTSFSTYTVTNDSWNGTLDQAASAKGPFDLSAITDADNNPLFAIRLLVTSTTSIAGATTAAGGTSRTDNIVFSGTPLVLAPEPTTLAAVGLLGAGVLGRRRKA